MANISEELRKQIEAAYDYRGHVTIRLKDGGTIEGYIFNREFANPRIKADHFIDVFLKDSDAKKRIPMAELASIELTGQDYAAGNSYEDYLKKKNAAKPGA